MNLHSGKLVLSLLLALSVIGCKKQSGSSAGGSDNFPQRVGESGDATALIKVGVLGKNGGKRLGVDLEKLPEYGSANLWSCYQLPADDFSFGKAICASDVSKNIDITSVHIDFTCEVNKEFGAVRAKKPLTFDGCESFDIHAYAFKPALELKITE